MTSNRFKISALWPILTVLLYIIFRYEPLTWITADGRFHVNAIVTMVQDGTLMQKRFASSWYLRDLGWNYDMDMGWSNISLGRHGEFWPKHSWIMPLLTYPFFVTIGLNGTLLFNLLAFILAGAMAIKWLDLTTRSEFSLAAISMFFLNTGVLGYSYDYQMDVLVLTGFFSLLYCIASSQTIWAGAIAATLIGARPTLAIPLFAPLLTIPDWKIARLRLTTFFKQKQVLYFCLGFACLAACIGAVQTDLFGRPWWSGYQRTLVREHGVLKVASHTAAFTYPLVEGLKRLWEGDFGLKRYFGMWLFCLVGMPFYIRRHTLLFCGALVASIADVLLFSKYVYDGHRFHWPLLALWLPGWCYAWEWCVGPTVSTASSWAKHVVRSTKAGMLFCVLCVASNALAENVYTFSPAIALIASIVVLSPLLPTVKQGNVVAFALCLWVLSSFAPQLYSKANLNGITIQTSTQLPHHGHFRLTSFDSVSRMSVFHGATPCDFIEWEHMSWLCVGLDDSPFKKTGLRWPTGIVISGKQAPLVGLTTGHNGESRRLAVPMHVDRSKLTLTYGVPDPQNGTLLQAYIDGVPLFSAPIQAMEHRLEHKNIDVSRWLNRSIILSLVVTPLPGDREGGIGIDVQM